jgi:TRAP-type transport system periplasmic protein
VKFRVMTNPLLVESLPAFGATPTPLPWGEVYGALQTNHPGPGEPHLLPRIDQDVRGDGRTSPMLGHNNFTTA